MCEGLELPHKHGVGLGASREEQQAAGDDQAQAGGQSPVGGHHPPGRA